MSRTYRTHREHRYMAWGRLWTSDEREAHAKSLCEPTTSRWLIWERLPGWKHTHVTNPNARDQKPWNKPPKSFKQANRRIERARVAKALRNDREVPVFKKTDQWDWT